MKFLTAILLAFLTLTVNAGTGAIPSGPNVKLLKDNLRFKNTDTKIMTNDSDNPSVTAKDAEIGSLYIKSDDGVLYQKQDAGSSTNWLPMVLGPSGSGTDECLVRWDGTGVTLIQDSVVCVTDLGVMTGLTQLNVDNLRLDGNTISSQDVNGNIILDPNGTGQVNLPDLTVSQPAYIDASGNLVSQDIDLTADVTGVLPVANGGTNSSTALTNDKVMLSSGGAIVESGALADGQLIIGATGAAPAPANISGTVNQVSVANGANSITLSTPQDIATTSDVTFNSVSATTSVSAATVDGTTSVDGGNLQLTGNTLQSTDLNGNVILDPNGTGQVNLPDLTVSQPAYIDASGNLVSQDLDLTADVSGVLPIANGGTNSSTALNNDRMILSSGGSIVEGGALADGQIFIGATGAAPTPATITGTANQVNVANGTNSITLSTPQDIATTSSPTFVGATLSGLTQNSILFAGSGGVISEDNTNFTFNDGTDTLGLTGVLNVDNLSFDGNTIASSDTNGNIILNPDGTGNVQLPDLTVSSNLTLDASGNIAAVEETVPNLNIFHQQRFEYDIDSSDFLCGTNLTASNETVAPISGATSVDIDQGVTAATAGTICDSQAVTLEDKHQDKFVSACIYTVWDGNDNEMAMVINDNTNSTELGEVLITASTEPKEHCVYFQTASNTASIDYDIEVQTGNDNTTLRIDDLQLTVDPLTPTDIYASSEWESYTPTFTGLGTVTNVAFEWRRDGDNLLIRGSGTSGTVTATECRVSFPSSLTSELINGSLKAAGDFLRGVADTNTNYVLVEDNVSYMTFGRQGTGAAALSKLNCNGLIGSSENFSLLASFPIAGWSDTAQGVVVKNVESSDIGNTNVFSAAIAVDGSVTTENIDFINGNCSVSTSTYTCDFNSGLFSVAPSCVVTVFELSASDRNAFLTNISESQVQYRTQNASTGADNDNPVKIICQKQGTDFVKESEKVYTVPIGFKESEFYSTPTGTTIWGGTGVSTDIVTSAIPLTGSTTVEWDEATAAGVSRLVAKQNIDLSVMIQGEPTSGSSIMIRDSSDNNLTLISVNTSSFNTPLTLTLKLAKDDFIYFRGDNLASTNGALAIWAKPSKEDGLWLGNFGQPTCYVKDVKASGTNGGTGTSASFGATAVRDLNTTSGDCSFLSLSSNVITLESGTYKIDGCSMFHRVGNVKTRLYDITNSSAVSGAISLSGFTPNDTTFGSSNSCPPMKAQFTANGTTDYRIEYFMNTSVGTTDLGVASSSGSEEYSVYAITKVR